MRNLFIITIAILFIIISVGLLINTYVKKSQEGIEKIEKEGEEGKMTDVLLIVANDFQGIELDGTKTALQNAGLTTEIASLVKNPRSVQGKIIDSDLLLKEVNVSSYKAIVFIGGPGASTYFNDTTALSIAKKSYEQGKIVAAICIAPVILANAGLLEGKSATVWDSGSGEMIGKIETKGAIFQSEAVVQDGKIITANGPAASKKFGELIAKAIKT